MIHMHIDRHAICNAFHILIIAAINGAAPGYFALSLFCHHNHLLYLDRLAASKMFFPGELQIKRANSFTIYFLRVISL
jgi:hypothetical protein